MNSIYSMDLSFNFLIQAARVLQVKNYLGFENDLILYVEIINALIYIFEESEEYEKCHVLKLKKDECNKIINN